MSAARTHRGLTLARVSFMVGVVVAATTLAAPSALAAPPDPAPAPTEPIEVTLDSATIGSAPGTVVLTGTVTCDNPVEAVVFGDVAQVQGLDIARDFFGFIVQCSSTPSAWTATSEGALRVFLPLPTVINVEAGYCVEELCYTTSSISQTLTLPTPAT
jgi:hypothetical protein